MCYWCRQGQPTAAAIATPVLKARTIEDVRAAANARPHRCAGYMCIAQVPGDRLMCEGHLALLPVWLHVKLEKAYNPRAATAWPQELVEEAIRFTMTDGDREALVARVEGANQGEMFALRSAGGGR